MQIASGSRSTSRTLLSCLPKLSTSALLRLLSSFETLRYNCEVDGWKIFVQRGIWTLNLDVSNLITPKSFVAGTMKMAGYSAYRVLDPKRRGFSA